MSRYAHTAVAFVIGAVFMAGLLAVVALRERWRRRAPGPDWACHALLGDLDWDELGLPPELDHLIVRDPALPLAPSTPQRGGELR